MGKKTATEANFLALYNRCLDQFQMPGDVPRLQTYWDFHSAREEFEHLQGACGSMDPEASLTEFVPEKNMFGNDQSQRWLPYQSGSK